MYTKEAEGVSFVILCPYEFKEKLQAWIEIGKHIRNAIKPIIVPIYTSSPEDMLNKLRYMQSESDFVLLFFDVEGSTPSIMDIQPKILAGVKTLFDNIIPPLNVKLTYKIPSITKWGVDVPTFNGVKSFLKSIKKGGAA